MTCLHRLWGDPTGLTCTRTDDHATGHTYTGTAVDDGKHDDRTDNQ